MNTNTLDSFRNPPKPLTTEQQKTVEEWHPLACKIARSFSRTNNMDYEELVTYSVFGLISAVQNFDPFRGVPLKQWIVVNCKRRLCSYLKYLNRERRALTTSFPVRFSDYEKEKTTSTGNRLRNNKPAATDPTFDAPSPEDRVEETELLAVVRSVPLDRRLRKVRDLWIKGWNLPESAFRLGKITKERVRQLRQEVVARLQEAPVFARLRREEGLVNAVV